MWSHKTGSRRGQVVTRPVLTVHQLFYHLFDTLHTKSYRFNRAKICYQKILTSLSINSVRTHSVIFIDSAEFCSVTALSHNLVKYCHFCV